jgi:hypothetical protein
MSLYQAISIARSIDTALLVGLNCYLFVGGSFAFHSWRIENPVGAVHSQNQVAKASPIKELP